MSDIKKTALIVLILTLLTNIFTQNAYAANDYNHSELLEYEGYGDAMFESIVEQTTFISGQYTDNKDYVRQSIDQIIDYANTWKNDFNNWDQSCNSDFIGCMRGMLEGAGGYALTVGDWIKNLFDDYDQYENKDSSYVDWASYFYDAGTRVQILEGYHFTISQHTGYYKNYIELTYSSPILVDGGYLVNYSLLTDSYRTYLTPSKHTTLASANEFIAQIESNKSNVSYLLGLANQADWDIKVYKGNEQQVATIVPNNNNIHTINNYIKENGQPEVILPQLKPVLVCPDGTRIQMGINGSTFIAVNGETMIVNKDGTAEVNGVICNLNWQNPNIEYTPDGKVKVDDEITDDNPPDFTDLEGCNGVIMCGIAKMLDGLGSVVKAITGLVTKLLDGILALFVPEDLDFITEEFNKITKKLNDKIAITETLKKAITDVFDGGGSNPLANISINLPITNEPLTFGNVSFIEEGVPILRRVISAIVVLYTIAYVYRKITGRGGVMER